MDRIVNPSMAQPHLVTLVPAVEMLHPHLVWCHPLFHLELYRVLLQEVTRTRVQTTMVLSHHVTHLSTHPYMD